MSRREILTAAIIMAISVPDVYCATNCWARNASPETEVVIDTDAESEAPPKGSPESGPETSRPDYYEAEPEIIDTIKIDDLKPVHNATREEILMMARIVQAEAGNQSQVGKRLVADVILNRLDDPDFPGDTITDVITYPGAFSSYTDGGYAKAKATDEDIIVVMDELEAETDSNVLYFTAGGYGKYGTPWRQVEDHYFCDK